MAAVGRWLRDGLTVRKIMVIVLGAMICSFGIYNIHQRTDVTEGGILGLMLFFEHWLGFSPAYITPVLDLACYGLAFRFLGAGFIKISAISTFFVSVFFKIWEQFPPMLPDLSAHPLIAALLGAVFVGVGVGLIIRQGGSGTGDDALALSIAKLARLPLARAYLVTDLTVLLLSLSYIPLKKILFSLITVTLSSYMIEGMQRIGKKKEK